MKLSNYLTGIRIDTTANPNGVTLKHSGEFDPTGKAIATDDGYVIPAVNTMRKPRTLIEEAGVIIQLTSEKMARRVVK